MHVLVNGVSTLCVLIADQLVRFTISVGQDYNVLNVGNVSTNHYGVLNNDFSSIISPINSHHTFRVFSNEVL